MATKINTTTYSKINADIIDIMRTGLYSGVNISIYTDETATVFATDGNAPIENVKISKLNTTGAFTIAATSEFVNGSIELVFGDGSSFKVVDTVDEFWCTLEGIVYTRRTF